VHAESRPAAEVEQVRAPQHVEHPPGLGRRDVEQAAAACTSMSAPGCRPSRANARAASSSSWRWDQEKTARTAV